MTNKEAIKYLIAPVATSTKPSAEYLKQKEAYELAIKALEQQSINLKAIYQEGYCDGHLKGYTKAINEKDYTEAGDYKEKITMINISKEEIWDKMFFVRKGNSDQPIAVIKVSDLLEEEQPKGEWKPISTGLAYKYQCSLCGRTISTTPMFLSDYPFCHCGAKMKD